MVRRLKSMQNEELYSKHGTSVVLFLALLGGTLLISVPVTTDASPIIQVSDTTRDTMFEPILREHRERIWDFPKAEPLSDFQWKHRDVDIKSDDIFRESKSTLDLVPFGTPHAPIFIDDNSDFESQGWPGEGTVEQPYIVAGLEINATTGASAINITNTDVHFFIKDCRLTSNSTNVIELRSVTHVRITNNTILQGERGVAAFHSSDLTIYDNEFYTFSWAGVYLEDCSLSSMRNNNCTSCDAGFHIEQSEQCTVENNFILGSDTGIELYWDCEYINVFNNTIQDSWRGIYVYLNCHDNILDSNNCTRIQHIAITVVACSENSILNNFCYLHTAGIVLLNCKKHTIAGNDCGLTSGEFSGSIRLENTNRSLVTNNHVENASINILLTGGSSYNEVSNNNCSIFDAGIVAWDSSPHNTITNNICDGQGVGVGIYADYSSNCTISDNQCHRLNINIGAFVSDQIVVANNVCYESVNVSLVFFECEYLTVEDNILENGSTGIAMEWIFHSSIRNNIISNFTGSWGGFSGIHLKSVGYTSIEGNTITECNEAIYVETSGLCNITDNTCIDNFDGIVLVDSNVNITVEDNLCHLQEGYAIVVVESFNCSVIRNTCTNTSGGEGFSLLLGDCEADVSWNSFSLSTGGIEIVGCDGEITHNIITNNEMYGITIQGLIGPNATWNVFEDNGLNAVDDSSTSMFDYNYWSNYAGIDSNADGIGDTWHPINGVANNNDTHPLVYRPTLPTWEPDLADQVSELGRAFEYVLSYAESTVLAPFVDWWVNDTTHFSIGDGTVANAVFLDFGEYPLEVKAINLYGFGLSGTFTVTVSDTIAPAIIGPDDFDYIAGQVGRAITWIPEDYDPASYSVALDGIEVQSGAWNSTAENVTISVDGLSVGIHTFVVTFADGTGNTATDTVIVTVQSDFTPLFIVAGVGSVAVLIIIVVYLVRKKGAVE